MSQHVSGPILVSRHRIVSLHDHTSAASAIPAPRADEETLQKEFANDIRVQRRESKDWSVPFLLLLVHFANVDKLTSHGHKHDPMGDEEQKAVTHAVISHVLRQLWVRVRCPTLV
eukprot:CAMPEP_0119156390 /NCGR_PEP_ID=MMETSP1310-20130426/52232_1 /TAXON_ID=464262 /ORGANISM="Genus nov. species nov., Strain RCC2339" /LENGTH=114 /DNA_ID=CAMNT_0007149003 /DNA_START=407 /DNA_END=751 /DNA_ORIENTATION=-